MFSSLSLATKFALPVSALFAAVAVFVGLSFPDQMTGTLVGLLIFLVGLATAFGVSRLVTAPLRGVAESVERISKGDLTHRAEVKAQDEVGILAGSFNRMVENLGSAYRALEDANRGLEERVEERTEALRRAQLLERDRNQVLERIARGEPLAAVMLDVANLVEHQCPAAHCALWLVRDAKLILAASPSLLPESTAALRERAVSDPASAVALASRERRPVRVPGPEGCREDGAGAYPEIFAVPILTSGGVVLGAIALLSPASRTAVAGESQLVERMARLAAIAVEQRQLSDRLAHQAHHDALTGLPNRVLFEDRLQQALVRARRRGDHVALLFVDLDRFKQVNDTLGHAAGDTFLSLVARRLLTAVRQGDTLARMGGDEFTLILTDLSDPAHAVRVAHKLLESLRLPIVVKGQEIFVTASVGISVYGLDASDSATLQIHSDSAMYRVKDRGGNDVQCFAPEMGGVGAERLRLESGLQRALQRQELELDFQPQVDLSGRLVGVEALVRWNHPDLGRIPPGTFIPLAEENGSILAIGAWVLDEACRAAARWRASVGHYVQVSVNVSPHQFNQADLAETVERALKTHGLPAGVLQLELTEGLLLADVTAAAASLARLKAAGVSVAIDDFGTGYSSLAYLQRLPIDLLKIDQAFIRDLGSQTEAGQRAAKLVQTIVTLGHALGLDVMAEGVETQQQLDFLKRAGCDKAQGFLFHRPLPAEAIEALLKAYGSPVIAR